METRIKRYYKEHINVIETFDCLMPNYIDVITRDTIRTLQNSSAARIQITRDAEAGPHSANNQDWACDETIIKFLLGLLLQADVAIVRLPDESGFTGMHVAARRKRAELTAIFDRILQMTGSAIEKGFTAPHNLSWPSSEPPRKCFASDNGDDETDEFSECVRVLAEKVGVLTRRRESRLRSGTYELRDKKETVFPTLQALSRVFGTD
ncbi:hypothetical protein Tco_0687457 [Tanacetum coccineum]